MNNIELLAPSGDEESLIAAINAGANAVYLGVKNFNARNKASNFDQENLRKYIRLAHLHNVKVYLVVNTLIKNGEVSEFIQTIKQAVSAKVDAFIIQDLGVAKILRECFPGIVMHASTQMGIHNLEGALVAKELGISRIVLSRETTLSDIKRIHENVDIEIESFVHGALCVAFSGICYLSSILKGESGNRGRCLGLCRLPYSALSNDKKIASGYLLSTSDLCYITRLKELIDAGVCSFKIEGRLRRPSYVAQVVSTYRRALENLDNVQNFKQDKDQLKKVFYRGEFNEGLYLDNQISKDLINPLFQNHRGIKIGEVRACEKFKDIYRITLSSSHNIKNGDGLKFVFNNSEISVGVGNVNKVKGGYEIFSKSCPKVKSEVFLTVDSTMEKNLLEVKNRIPISAHFSSLSGKKAMLKLMHEEIVVEVFSDQTVSTAKTSPVASAQIKENVDRLVDTEFILSDFSCELENVFIPKSLVNKMRRDAISLLEEKIISRNEQHLISPIFNENFRQNIEQVFEDNCDFEEVRNEDQKTNKNNVIISPNNYEIDNINKLVQNHKNKKIYLSIPPIKRGKDDILIKKILSTFSPNQIGLFINNIYGFYYSKFGYEIIPSYRLNLCNNFALLQAKELGAINAQISIERDLIQGLNHGVKFDFSPALMTFVHCPYKTAFNYSSCSECKAGELALLSNFNTKYKIERIKVSNCYFELKKANR